jgi:chromobox protein 1
MEILEEYWNSIGGKPEVKTKKRKGRKSAAEKEVIPAKEAKRAKKEKEWSPPPGSWELDVDFVDTVEESLDNKTGKKERFAYLVWNNQKKTQHPLAHVYQKCPQKMLKYYESHL